MVSRPLTAARGEWAAVAGPVPVEMGVALSR
jgi:hypothetical protein